MPGSDYVADGQEERVRNDPPLFHSLHNDTKMSVIMARMSPPNPRPSFIRRGTFQTCLGLVRQGIDATAGGVKVRMMLTCEDNPGDGRKYGGVMSAPVNMLTAQNLDLQFGTNVIGHFFLTELLLPALKGGPERDVWVKKQNRLFCPYELYGQSKIFVSNYFAKTHSGVLVSAAVHPGTIKTELSRHTPHQYDRVPCSAFLCTASREFLHLWQFVSN
ncbi:hypothetical protein DFH06DRAFT_58392 [Mycena polygramma]|nr:hypothetical protein DFH06DRAFT_58392 [Mycena polygramma]